MSTEIQFKDVAHFYLGSKVIYGNTVVTLTAEENEQDTMSLRVLLSNPTYKLALYPLSAMTASTTAKVNELYSTGKSDSPVYAFEVMAKHTKILVDARIDCFGLIESWQAVDVTTLPNDPYKS